MQTLPQLLVFSAGQHCIVHFQKQAFEQFYLYDRSHLPTSQHAPPTNCFIAECFSQSRRCSFLRLTMPSCGTHQSVFQSYLGYASEVLPHLALPLLLLSSTRDQDYGSACAQPRASPRFDDRCCGTEQAMRCHLRAHSSDSQCGISRSLGADWYHSADVHILRLVSPAHYWSCLWAHLSLQGSSQSIHSSRQLGTELLGTTAKTYRRALWPPFPTAASSSWDPWWFSLCRWESGWCWLCCYKWVVLVLNR